MPDTSWDEIRTAYHVARLGTVSGAAEALGVHHATVIRHVDALEARIGVRLFQRHARGYTPTEAGEDLLKVGKATDDQLNQLVARIRGQGSEVRGELVVTTVVGLAGLFLPIVAAFQREHPQLSVRYLSDSRVFRLEFGEAHVAIRAGSAPREPDNVIQPIGVVSGAMVVSTAYVERYGMPAPFAWSGHRFVGHASDGHMPPYYRWLHGSVPAGQIVFRAAEAEALEQAVIGGIGIGHVSRWRLAARPELIEVMPPMPEWEAQLWLVTHVDLHRTTKVQAFLGFVKASLRGLPLAAQA